MAERIEMPKMSDTMTEGVIVSWLKEIGDTVKSGDIIAEVETDKATMELEAYQDGVLLYRGVEAGGRIPVGALLAILGKSGEDISALINKKNPDTQTIAKKEPTNEKNIAPEVTVVNPTVEVSVIQPENDSRVKASPLAKAIAKDKGIDLAQISGSGDGGRIIKRDLENVDISKPKTSNTTTAPKVISGIGETYEDVPTSQMRRTIARRLAESKFTAPHFYLTIEILMDEAIRTREALNQSSSVKISFNDMVVKAVASALRRHPKVNASWFGDYIRFYHHIHVGVAVAVEDGLLVPVIRFTDTKGLSQIAEETRSYAQKAKNKQLQPTDWEGNTFTISNLGMFGIDQFTAIINPPDACILAVGAITQQPVVKNGELAVGNVMKVTLSCDHRVVDGALGAAFLQTLKENLENPVRMLL